MTQTVLLVGATGTLGSRIATRLVPEAGVALRLLVRPGALRDLRKAAALTDLIDAGATLVEGDLTDSALLRSALEGVDVVISAVQGGAETILDGQLALARAAAAAGVRRFLPSDFALDLFHAPEGAPMFDLRRQAAAELALLDLDVVHVLNGAFMDMLLDPQTMTVVDVDQRSARYWGGGDDPFDVTLVDDVAAFTARLAVDPQTSAGTYAISGSRTTFNAIVDEVEQVLGEPIERTQQGSIADLQSTVDAAANPWSVIGAWYNLAMLTTPPFAEVTNDRYPDVRPTTLTAYLQQTLTSAGTGR